MIKIWRSWKSAFGEFSREFIPEQEESWNVTDIYTDGELERIRRAGFNAVWVHAQLNHIVRTGIFPELGEYAVEFRKRLNILTERAARHGIGIYLYLQVPRGLPQGHPLWKKHPECAGMPDIYSDINGNPVVMIPMCTSMPATRKYLQCAAEELARRLPRLAGVILITASEYPSHCYGRGGRMVPDGDRLKFIPVDCPHCLERTPAEVITEVIGIVSGGIHAVAPQMRVIAWNWSWTFFEESPCPNLIRRLPRDVNLLIDFERGGLRRNGATLEEYSLGYAGPSERFRLACGEARKHGLEVFAKFQLGTTHELAVVPNLPLLENIRRKASRFSALNLNGFMGCWNFGNMPSANVTAFQYFLERPEASLEEFAAAYFPGSNAEKIAEAWNFFTTAMEEYPLYNPWLYFGPANFSPALPLEPGPLSNIAGGRSWLPEAVRGDDIGKAFRQCSPEEVIAAFEKILPLWEKGTYLLRDTLGKSGSIHAREELSSAEACGLLFRSSLNCVRSYRLKLQWEDSRMGEWRRIALDELENLRKLLPLAESDRRIGYHIEAHTYLFTPEQIRKKIETLQKIKENHHEVFELEKSDPAAGAPELPVRCYGCK